MGLCMARNLSCSAFCVSKKNILVTTPLALGFNAFTLSLCCEGITAVRNGSVQRWFGVFFTTTKNGPLLLKTTPQWQFFRPKYKKPKQKN